MEYIEMESEYARYVSEKIAYQKRMERSINEALILVNENYSNSQKIQQISVLNESVGDKLTGLWDKFKTLISKIWNKFIEMITRVCSSDQSYLNKYKEIILKNKLKFTFTVKGDYAVGMRRLANAITPIINGALYDQLPNSTEDEAGVNRFRKKLVPDYTDTKIEFTEFCKQYFVGGDDEKTYDADNINMTDVWNYLYNYQSKTVGALNKEKNTLVDKAIQAFKAKAQEIDSAAKSAPSQTPPVDSKSKQGNTGGQNPPPTSPNTPPGGGAQGATGGQNANGESTTYSELYGNVVHELQINNGNTVDTGGSDASGVHAKSQINKSGYNDQTDQKANKDGMTNAVSHMNKEKNDPEAEKIFTNRLSIYQTNTKSLLTAKMTAAEKMYKDLMTIVKKHVSSYVGEKQTADNTQTVKSMSQFVQSLPKLEQNDINELQAAINAAEKETDETRKKELINTAIGKAQTISNTKSNNKIKFTGTFEDIKSWIERDKPKEQQQQQKYQS